MPTAKSSKKSTYSLQITPAGLIFSIMVMLVAVLALSSGNNLLYVLVAVLAATLAFSLFASRSILSRVDQALFYPERASVGEEVCFDLTILNRRRFFPVLSLTATLIEQPSWSRRMMRVEQGYLPLLPRRTEARVCTKRSFTHRGVYRLCAFRLETRSPFGFFEHRRLIPVEAEMWVHPVNCPVTALEEILPRLQGGEESQRKGSGGDLYALRDSQGGDPHHYVDWKATARTGRLMVREFTNEDQWQVTILLDWTDEVKEGGEHFYEMGIIIAASLADYLSRRGAQIQLVTPRRAISFGSGPAHVLAILDLLAELPVWLTKDGGEGWWVRMRRVAKWSGLPTFHSAQREEVRTTDGSLTQPGLLAGGSVIVIVPTTAEVGNLANDERITIIACDQMPPDFMATPLVK